MIDTGVFRLANDINHLYFKNPKRIDETVLFEDIIKHIQTIEGVSILDKGETPFGEHYDAVFEGKMFCIGIDADYGVFVYAEDNEVLSIIENKIIV